MLDKMITGFMQELVNFFKTSFSAVIGIGNAPVQVGVTLIEKKIHFTGIICRSGQLEDVGFIGGVHGKDVVESVKISDLELPGPLPADVDTMFEGFLLHAFVGSFTDVVGGGSRRIDLQIKSELIGFMPEQAFSHG